MRARYAWAVCASFAIACDAIPDLYVVDASVGEATDGGGNEAASDAQTAGQDAGGTCVGVSCPRCPPNPGACCPSGVACLGPNCATDCAACSSCTQGEVCCSKQNGPPQCRNLDAGKCPP